MEPTIQNCVELTGEHRRLRKCATGDLRTGMTDKVNVDRDDDGLFNDTLNGTNET